MIRVPKGLVGRNSIGPVLAAIVVVAIVVGLAAVYYVHGFVAGVIPTSASPPPQPLELALGLAAEGTAGGNYWYNFSIQQASGGAVWDDVELVIKNPGGAVGMSGNTTWSVSNFDGKLLCSAVGEVASSWTAGPAGSGESPVAPTQMLSVESTTGIAGQGDLLYVSGIGPYTGAVQAPIP